MAEPRPYRLAIFDFDGTLADSGGWFLSLVDEIADRFGLRRVSQDEVEMLRGRSAREVMHYVGLSRWRLPAVARWVQARFAAEAEQIALFPGVPELLAHLDAAGVTLALVTSNSRDNACRVLGPDLAARMRFIEGGASLFGKAPKFKRVLRRAGLAPSAAIAIGDETRDVAAARAVGVASGVVTWGYARADALLAMRPDLVFDSTEAIGSLLAG